RERSDSGKMRDFAERLRQRIAGDVAFPFAADLRAETLDDLVERLPARLVWGKATLLADRPDKPLTSEPTVVERLRAIVGPLLRQELLVESAYFIPAGAGT